MFYFKHNYERGFACELFTKRPNFILTKIEKCADDKITVTQKIEIYSWKESKCYRKGRECLFFFTMFQKGVFHWVVQTRNYVLRD